MFKDKIKTIEELAEIIEKEKKKGRKVALCHGCFDLIHIGHIKHFNAAKRMADVLVVTITPDRFINKGPGRPVFNESLRLEFLANVEAVDYVGLNDAPDAVLLIKRLKPDFYVKGDEYKNLKEGGMRVKEKEMVENCGGRFVLTSEQTFSSSAIINKNFNFLAPDVSNFLKRVREKYTKNEIEKFIEKMSALKVLVVGEPIIDEYVYCRTVGTITKFPAISAVFTESSKMLGGAGAVARHIAEFAKSVEYIGIVGDKDNEKAFIKKELEKARINSHLIVAPGRFSVKKRRFVSGNYPTSIKFKQAAADDKMYKLFEIAFVENSLIDEKVEEKICSIIKQGIKENDLVVLSDFGHGMVTSKIAELISGESKWWALNAQTNSTNYGFNLVTKYQGPNFVCIDELEARLPFGDRYKSRQEIVNNLSERLKCQDIMMSMGREGLLLKLSDFYYAPALTLNTVDTVGAGDAVLSMASLCRYLKLPPLATVFLSSVMGAMATQIVCNMEPVRKRKFIKFIRGTLQS